MNVFESHYERLLAKRLAEQQLLKRDALEKGLPKDFPAYRELVGYMKALEDVAKIMKTVSDTLNREEEAHGSVSHEA